MSQVVITLPDIRPTRSFHGYWYKNKNKNTRERQTTTTQGRESSTVLVCSGVLEVVDLVEHDGKPVTLGEGLDAVAEHGLPDNHNLQPTGVQKALDTLSGQKNENTHQTTLTKPHREHHRTAAYFQRARQNSNNRHHLYPTSRAMCKQGKS